MITSERINGKEITVIIESSNMSSATYNTEGKELIVEFKNKRKYSYQDVPWELFTKFRMSESQGKFFNAEIMRKYEYKEIKIENDQPEA